MRTLAAKRLVILPVRRSLMAVTMAYLTGILTTTVVEFPMELI